jgi:hypothetical protein
MKLTDKQKEILLALVEGKEVEYFSQRHDSWCDLDDLQLIGVFPNEDLRIKPETPKDIVVKEYKKYLPCLDDAYDEPNVEYTFDGVTHVLKSVKMIKEESREQPTDNGWINNIGNDTFHWPDGYGVRSDTWIEVKRRNNTTVRGRACTWNASWHEIANHPLDIIEFRILKD